MTIQQEKGLNGENTAVRFLENKGYRILERNYRAGRYEIDIIARHKGIMVFIEVKARGSLKFGNPEDFVDDAKAERVMEGAENYLDDVNWEGPIRFDIISIVLVGKDAEVKHFKDAFY